MSLRPLYYNHIPRCLVTCSPKMIVMNNPIKRLCYSFTFVLKYCSSFSEQTIIAPPTNFAIVKYHERRIWAQEFLKFQRISGYNGYCSDVFLVWNKKQSYDYVYILTLRGFFRYRRITIRRIPAVDIFKTVNMKSDANWQVELFYSDLFDIFNNIDF